jgi:hypothetical protein
VPRLGSGHLWDLSVAEDGKHAGAVFAVTKKTLATSEATYAAEDWAEALVKVSLASGRIVVVDDSLATKQIAHIALDTSRRHVLVYGNTTGQPIVSRNDPGKAIARYDRGTVTWLPGTRPPERRGGGHNLRRESSFATALEVIRKYGSEIVRQKLVDLTDITPIDRDGGR